jgi:hypothetical protein
MEDKKLIADILKEGLEPVQIDDISYLRERLLEGLKKSMGEIISEDEKPGNEKKKFNKWYIDVQQDLNKKKNPTGPSQAGVIRSLNPNYDNMSPSEQSTERSLFRKKLNKEKNEEGGQYLFSIEELAKIRSILGIG